MAVERESPRPAQPEGGLRITQAGTATTRAREVGLSRRSSARTAAACASHARAGPSGLLCRAMRTHDSAWHGAARERARDEDEVAPRWRQGAAKVQRSRTRATGQQDRGARHAKARVFEACGAQSSHLRPLVRTLEQHGWSRNAQKHPGGGGSGLPSTISLRSCSLLLTVENLPTASLLRRNKHLFYNHFERNTEITTKHALAQNLDLLHWNHGVSAKQVFPRCYSLHDDAGRRNFREDYRQTAAASVVRSILEVGDEALRLVDTRLFRMALLVCDERVGRLLGQVSRARTFSDTEWESLVELSAQLAVLDGTSANTTQRIAGLDAQVGGLVAKARQLASQLSRLDPQWIMNGRRNIWIVKPGDKSKAAGIFLHNQLKAIEANGARMGGARIVQKYIENPQLGPGQRKLDLRVWVLVTSWAPLKAWIYNPFYCRMCRDPYSLATRDLSRASVHLCNASVQGTGSILSMENLLLHLRSEGQVSTAADERKLSASIETACRLALQAGLHKVIHRDRSFELYGIDLLMDDELRCWLLEVNLSPGFGKHDDAFTAMVERMLHGLHDLVFARSANDASECRDVAPERSCQSMGGWKPLITGVAERNNGQSSSNEDLDLPTQRVDPRIGQDVSDCEEEPRRVKLSAAASLRLLVKGHRLHRRQISRLDHAIRSGEALEAIARFTSMCKQNWPAVRHHRRHAATIISRAWSSYQYRVFDLRCTAATCIQAWVRSLQAMQRVETLWKNLKTNKSMKIAHWWRCVHARHVQSAVFCAWKQRTLHAVRLVRKLQRLWRARQARKVSRRESAARVIQAWIRRDRGRRLLRARHLASETIAWAWFAFLERQRHRRKKHMVVARAACRIQVFWRSWQVKICSVRVIQRLARQIACKATNRASLLANLQTPQEPPPRPMPETLQPLQAAIEAKVRDEEATNDREKEKKSRRKHSRAFRKAQAESSMRLARPRVVREKHGARAKSRTARRGTSCKSKKPSRKNDNFISQSTITSGARHELHHHRKDTDRSALVVFDGAQPVRSTARKDQDGPGLLERLRAREEELCVELWRHSTNRPQLPAPLDI